MLKPAIEYKEEVRKLLEEAYYNDKESFSYYHPNYNYVILSGGTKIEKNTMRKHQFVSVHNGKVVGFISYSIDLQNYKVYNLQIINFVNHSITFAVDLKKAIENIFEVYKFRKLSVEVFVGHPIESSYDSIFEKIGGRIVGIQKEHCRMDDGKLRDLKIYEVLRKDYLKARGKLK